MVTNVYLQYISFVSLQRSICIECCIITMCILGHSLIKGQIANRRMSRWQDVNVWCFSKQWRMFSIGRAGNRIVTRKSIARLHVGICGLSGDIITLPNLGHHTFQCQVEWDRMMRRTGNHSMGDTTGAGSLFHLHRTRVHLSVPIHNQRNWWIRIISHYILIYIATIIWQMIVGSRWSTLIHWLIECCSKVDPTVALLVLVMWQNLKLLLKNLT